MVEEERPITCPEDPIRSLSPTVAPSRFGASNLRVASSVLAVAVLASCGRSATAPSQDEEVSERWETFTVAGMRAELERQGVSYLTVLDELTFRMGLLEVPVGTDVGLVTNQRDVVYYVVGGAALLSTDSVDVEMGEGRVVFVRGDVEHRIRDVEADLEMVVFFRITVPRGSDPEIVAFAPAEMTEGENLERSVFNPLLTTSSLGVGMYMVPKGMDPDAFMRHSTDEIKLIADGAARFDIGSTSIMAVNGSIAFIRDGVQHQFRRVAEALDVLVLWAR